MAGDNGNPELTIDELARRSGMTVRNIRAHQSRGLLPPPEVRGRTGYYGVDHLDRLELIKELQADGFNLELIGKLLDSSGGSSSEVLNFTRAVRAPFIDEEPQVVSLADLGAQLQANSPALLDRALELGLIRPLGEDNFEIVSPRLMAAGAELVQLGIPLEKAIEVVARVRHDVENSAKTFAKLFVDQVWKPFDDAGRPDERWPEVQESIERLRPLASETVLAMFQVVMDEVAETTYERTIARIRPEGRRRRPKP